MKLGLMLGLMRKVGVKLSFMGEPWTGVFMLQPTVSTCSSVIKISWSETSNWSAGQKLVIGQMVRNCSLVSWSETGNWSAGQE